MHVECMRRQERQFSGLCKCLSIDIGLARHGPEGRLAAVPSFDDLLAEGSAVPVDGWDFSWFEGRATEERPPWGYARILAVRMGALADVPGAAALDLQTGGGEVLATIPAGSAGARGHRVLASQC